MADMAWAERLWWAAVPVGGDGTPDDPERASGLIAYVGVDLSAGAVPVAVTLRNADGGPVTPAQWRRVQTSALVRAARGHLAVAGVMLDLGARLGYLDEEARQVGERLVAGAGDEEPRPRRYPPEHYRRIGALYDQVVSTGEPEPRQTLRRILRPEFPWLTDSMLKGWIRTAQLRGHSTLRARTPRAQAKGQER